MSVCVCKTHLRDLERAEEDGGEGGLARVAEEGLVLCWLFGWLNGFHV
jgi:hypothetical protein